MGAEPGQAQPGQIADPQRELDRLIGGHAESLESNVDLHEHAERRVTPSERDGVVVRARGVEIGQRRDQAGGDDVARGVGQRVRIHENRQREAGVVQAHAVGQIGDAEGVGAVLGKRAAHFEAAEAVGVRFDDGEDLSIGADETSNRLQVLDGGVEVDLEPGGPQHQRGVYFTPEMGATTSL